MATVTLDTVDATDERFLEYLNASGITIEKVEGVKDQLSVTYGGERASLVAMMVEWWDAPTDEDRDALGRIVED